MPIVKYFVVVGAALAGLLLVAGWSLPETPARFSDRPEIVERAAIRIRSEHKWPDKVVLDTSKPMMAAPAAMQPPAAPASVPPLPSDQAPSQSNLDAMAQLTSNPRSAGADHPALQVKRGGVRTVRSRRLAGAPIVHRLATAEAGWSCCQLDKGQAGSNVIPVRRAASPLLFE